MRKPSEWVVRHASQIAESGQVLDLACGAGRHARFLLSRGFHVTCLDIDLTTVLDLASNKRCQLIKTDLENDSPWPFSETRQASHCGTTNRRAFCDSPSNNRLTKEDENKCQPIAFDGIFDGIVVTNYLYRPLLADLARSLADGGLLIYQTFMAGNEKFGRPRNPDHLLRVDELKVFFKDRLDIIDFTQGYVAKPVPAMVQQICARKLG